MDHRIDEVTVRDALGRFRCQFEVLEREVLPRRSARGREPPLEVVLLNEQGHHGVILEVDLDFVVERHSRHARPRLRSKQLRVQRPRRLQSILLVHLGPVRCEDRRVSKDTREAVRETATNSFLLSSQSRAFAPSL